MKAHKNWNSAVSWKMPKDWTMENQSENNSLQQFTLINEGDTNDAHCDRRPITTGIEVNGGPPEESKPRIRRGLYPMSIHQGNPVEFQVVATGWPTPTVKWFKNGEELKSDGAEGRTSIWTDERGVHHAVIIDVRPDDEADYSVVASNPLGEARTEGPLSVIRPRHPLENGDDANGHATAHPPGFIRQLKNKHVFTHMPTIFDCLVVGTPPPTVDWYHDGKKISPDGRTKIQVAGGGSHALIILDTKVEDAGEYVAIARNSSGTAQSSAILDVTVPHLDNIKFDGSIDVTPYLTEEYGFKKLNYKCLPTPPDRGPFIKEVTGHYLTLSWIPTKRTPPRYPQVTYVIEIRELPERDWTLLDFNIPEPVCKVRNLELGKSYQFRVRAENIYGISDPSPSSPPSRLMAPPRPVLDKNKRVIPLLDPYAEKALEAAYAEQYACAPWFAPGVDDKRFCADSDTITIALSYSGYPDPKIQWKFRGWDIDTTSDMSNIKVSNHGGAETILTITGFAKANVGQYQCIATNQYGDAQQNVHIDLGERPRFLQPLLDKVFSDGKPMKLDVRVEGSPFPEIKWLKDWRPIAESHRVKFVKDGPYLCSMIVTNPVWRDSGIYSVIAINEAGQATTSCTVTVEADGEYNDVQLPRKKVALEARKVREIYEIEEADEKKAATGAPFIVKEKKTGKRFVAQLKPADDSLKRGLAMHNVLDGRPFVQYHQVIADKGMALVVFEDADRSLLDDLLAPVRQRDSTSPSRNREEEVRIFVKQLLTALQYMHHRNIVHLDLRPEVVILHDDHLKLADFGQSRHLLAGKAKGEIAGSPEFVSPEVAKGTTVTLATDMWSAGVLTYVLLSGLSPFLGDNDDETLANVVAGRFNLGVSELADISPEAKDFLSKLMLLDPVHRLSVDQALQHDWLSDPSLAEARLSTDCLREFKYQHKWLERRVFVQQSPSEQITQLLATPTTSVNSTHPPRNGESVAEPFAVYDYLRIKDSPLPPPEVPEYDPRGRPQRRPSPRHSASPDLSHYQPLPDHFDPRDPRGRSQPHDFFDPRDPRNRDPRAFGGHPTPPHPYPRNGYGPGPRGPAPQHFDPRKAAIAEHFGGRVPSSDELRALIEQELPPGVKLPPGIKPEDLLFVLPPPYGQSMPPAPAGGAAPKGRPAPQGKPEPVTQNGGPRNGAPKSIEELSDQVTQQPPLRLVRGERREIEEEIANRILSDISEENSIAGSLASLDDFEPLSRMSMKERNKTRRNRRSRSRSSTPQADGNSEDTLTPVASPGPTIDSALDPLKQFFGDHVPLVPEFSDPKVPVGAPVFVDGLKHGQITVESGEPRKSSLSPRPRSGTPGTKSPVMLSPGREHKMEVVIATKRGTQDRTSPMHDAVEPLKKKKGHGDDDDDSPRKVAPVVHDKDFDDLMNEVERVKQAVKKHTVDDDLEKYRPKHFYKEEEFEPHRPEDDVDDYPWESAYQIGPDTLLLATRGPEFNARVRDYRRELWGDGAPLVRQGFLGYRNQDITVRERRRFTDLIREDPVIAKTIKETKQTSEVFQNGAIRKVTTATVSAVPGATKKNADGTFGAIFRSRLRDAHFIDHAPQLTLTCAVIGNPEPEISWMHHESTLTEDSNYKIAKEGDICKLTILRPSLTDLGEYTCVATNAHGTDKCSARVVSGEAPDRPSRPEVELSSDTEVLLTWEAPEMSTCLEGVTYKVECRPAGEGDHCAKWTTISDNVEDEAVVIRHLHIKGIYQFRVTAKNGFGFGIPSLTSRIIQTHPRGVPKLHIDSLRDQMKLSVLSMPQRRGRADPGLAEISETAEEEASEEELSIASSVSSAQPAKPLVLSSESPESRFQLESELFRGQFTIVRNAVDTSHSVARHVVAKIRVPATNLPPARLAEEFETLRESQHENVVTLLGAYEKDNTLLLFTERLYENVFERFTYPDYYNEEQIALTIRQLTSALHWIHFKGVLHLDVQPENVMFATKRSWIVKLIDFEESQFVDSPPPLKKRKPANPEWAAPELLQEGGTPTVQTDVWGMGIICFTLLAGFHPFSDDGETPDEVKEAVIKQKCDPNLIPVQATQEALRFATWAIKKNPARRIRTDEALTHRWLSSEKNMVRRRENVKFPSNRLRRTTLRTFNRPQPNIDGRLLSNYGGKN
uniref:Immunoglobulin I-set domain protein n=1 Tax=Panagrellus redivivus TaxID=6233 RepID=A0A7E4UT80_PANRE